jgi:hypothetical protein
MLFRLHQSFGIAAIAFCRGRIAFREEVWLSTTERDDIKGFTYRVGPFLVPPFFEPLRWIDGRRKNEWLRRTGR